MSNQQQNSSPGATQYLRNWLIPGKPLNHQFNGLVRFLWATCQPSASQVASSRKELEDELHRFKVFTAQLLLLTCVLVYYATKLEADKRGYFAQGVIVVNRLQNDKVMAEEKVETLEREKGQLEVAYRALDRMSRMLEAAVNREEGKVAGLERVATLYKEKLISRTKENVANVEMVKTLEAKVKLLEELNKSKEERLKFFEG